MLHVLQYFTGISIAAFSVDADLTSIQSVVLGARRSGSSSSSGGGMRCRFRGSILDRSADDLCHEVETYTGISDRGMYE